jgi:hypothetical protein
VADPERLPFMCPSCGGPMTWLAIERPCATCDTTACPNNWHGREDAARAAVEDGTFPVSMTGRSLRERPS